MGPWGRATSLSARSWVGSAPSRAVESPDVTTLPRRLDRSCVVMCANEVDGLIGRGTVQHHYACEGRTCPAATSAARDLNSFRPSPPPGFAECVQGVALVAREPKVRPANPSLLPAHGRRGSPEQVQPEVRTPSSQRRSAQPATPDQSARRKAQHACSRRVPRSSHILSVGTRPTAVATCRASFGRLATLRPCRLRSPQRGGSRSVPVRDRHAERASDQSSNGSRRAAGVDRV